jgi:hypothetical protein
MQNVALFDLDSSLANYSKAIVRDLQLLRSPEEPEITEENVWTLTEFDYMRARVRLIKSIPGWWVKLEPIEAGMLVYELCKMFGFNNHILTKGPKKHSLAWKEKVDWCQQHLGEEVDVHITSNKELTYGKLLYDDWPEYMLSWLKHRPRGLGIMPVTPQNREFEHPNVIKFDGTNLTEVSQAIHKCRYRKEGEVIQWKT